jgi:hypothetical protein
MPLPRRVAAWFVTGPAGHLLAGFLDWLELFTGWIWARVRRRDPWAPR